MSCETCGEEPAEVHGHCTSYPCAVECPECRGDVLQDAKDQRGMGE